MEEIPAFTIQFPNGGETVMIGKTISIRWRSNIYLAPEALLSLSPDGGMSWYPIVKPVNFQSDDWEDYSWTIPESISGIPLANKNCLLKITDYNLIYSDVSDVVFTIVPLSGIESPGRKGSRGERIALVRQASLWQIRVEALWPEYTLDIRALDGKLLRCFQGQGPGPYNFNPGFFSKGLYLITVRCETGAFSRLIVHTGR